MTFDQGLSSSFAANNRHGKKDLEDEKMLADFFDEERKERRAFFLFAGGGGVESQQMHMTIQFVQAARGGRIQVPVPRRQAVITVLPGQKKRGLVGLAC